MGRRHFKPEQIIHMLREAEIKLAGGKTTDEVCRELESPSKATIAGAKNTAACRYPRPKSSRTWNARMLG
jgi:hypothetical protein